MFFKLIQLAAICGAVGMLVILPTACAEGIRHNKDLPIDGEATSEAVTGGTGGPLVFKQSKEKDGRKWEPEDKNSIARLLPPSPPSPSPPSPSTAKSSKSSSSKCSKSGISKSGKSSPQPPSCDPPTPPRPTPPIPAPTPPSPTRRYLESEATLSTPIRMLVKVGR